jgi:hypothetical protein
MRVSTRKLKVLQNTDLGAVYVYDSVSDFRSLYLQIECAHDSLSNKYKYARFCTAIDRLRVNNISNTLYRTFFFFFVPRVFNRTFKVFPKLYFFILKALNNKDVESNCVSNSQKKLFSSVE